MTTLQDKIRRRASGIVLYGLVPPKHGTADERVAAIARRQVERLRDLPIDGLVLYDLQDEEARIQEARPFPFMETLDPFAYSRDHLAGLPVPKIIYRAVGKYSPSELDAFMDVAAAVDAPTVFVGAASRDQPVTTSLRQAYELHMARSAAPLLGGVAIPERHLEGRGEHLRMFDKMAAGCSFFVSQGVYDLNAAKNLVSDYHYHAREHGLVPAPIIFTLTPCGSAKTLSFMKWLGISIPPWLENELLHARDILEQSVAISEQNYRELAAFAAEKGVPVGCNVESVAVRKVEVEASIELLRRVAR